MLNGDRAVSGGWNFGPDPEAVVDVETIAIEIRKAWGVGAPKLELGPRGSQLHEAGILRLDSTKARTILGWRPRLSLEMSLSMTVDWYRAWASGDVDMRSFSAGQIDQYLAAGADRLFTGNDHSTEEKQCA